MPRGGRRQGAGRKTGSTKQHHRVPIGRRLPENMVAWLNAQPNVTQALEEAVMLLQEQEIELVPGYEAQCRQDLKERNENMQTIPLRYFLSSDGVIYAELPLKNPVSVYDTQKGTFMYD